MQRLTRPLLAALLALALLALLLPPFLWLAAQAPGAFRMLAGWAADPQEASRLAGLLLRTLGIAAGASAIALAAAVAVFIALEPLLARGRGAVAIPFLVPLVIPGHFLAIAWIQWFGYAGAATAAAGPAGRLFPAILYSPAGCALVLGLRLAPLAFVLIWAGWRSAGSAALEAAALLAPPGRLWRRFMLVWLRPWLLAGALLVFLAALLDTSIPSLLRQPVLGVEVVSAFSIYYEPGRAAALAMLQVLLSLSAAALFGLTLARVRWPSLLRRPAALPSPGLAARAAAFIIAVAAALSGWMLPAGMLAATARDLPALGEIWASARGQFWLSLRVCAAAALIATLAGAALAALGQWRPGSRRQSVAALIMLALLALPGSVVAMAMIDFWIRPLFGAAYTSGAMLPLGLAVVHLPVAWLLIRARLREIPAVLVDLHALAPLRPLDRWRLLAGPLAGPALFAFGLIFVLAMNEAQAAILLAAPGQETLSVRAMTLLHYAPDRLVAAFCLLAWGAALLPALAAWTAFFILRRLRR